MTLGLSVSGAVFINKAQNGLHSVLPNVPRSELTRIVAGTSSDLIKTLSEELRTQVIAVIVSTWQKTYVVGDSILSLY